MSRTKFDLYAIGYEYETRGKFGLTHGPTANLGELLEIAPPSDRSKIIYFPKEGTDDIVAYKVDVAGVEWEAIEFGSEGLLVESVDTHNPFLRFSS